MAVVLAWMRMVRVATLAATLGAFTLATIPVARAYPPDFPNLETFAAVDPAQFTHTANYGRGGTQTSVDFDTPDGVRCTWGHSESPAYHPEIACVGNIPGVPAYVADRDQPGCTQVSFGEFLNGSAPVYMFAHRAQNSGTCPSATTAAQGQRLSPGQKLTSTNITCAVAEGDVTACIDPIANRGFMLTPAGSWTF